MGGSTRASRRSCGPWRWTIRIPNSPWHFSDAEVGVRGEPRYRGEDNRAVLADVLGYDDATIDELEAEGVLSSRVPQR